MIRHYLATALLNMKAAPVTTAAKVLTLALGLVAVVVAVGVVSLWRSTDRALLPEPERVVTFTYSMKGEGFRISNLPASPPALTKYLREDVPELEKVAQLNQVGGVTVTANDRTAVLSGAFAEPDFLDIFQLEFVEGDARSALRQAQAMVLTKDAARRLFGDAPALGERLIIAGQNSAVVTGVIAPIEQPSNFGFDYLAVLRPQGGPDVWTNIFGVAYAVLPEQGLSRSDLNARIDVMISRRVPEDIRVGANVEVEATPATRLTELGMNTEVFGWKGGPFSVLTGLMGLGALVLGVACLNYANLSVAQGVSRASETAMRRVLGASLAGLLVQAWVEGLIVAFAALAITGLTLWAVAPAIKAQVDIDILSALALDPKALAIIVAVTLGADFLAGAYPAFAAGRTRPAQALRSGAASAGRGQFAKALVGIQFASASALLIAVLVIGQQNAHMRNAGLKAGADPVVVLPPQAQSGVSTESLRAQLAGHAQVKVVGETGFAPWGDGESYMGVSRTPLVDEQSATLAREREIGFGYFEALDQKVLAGRVYDPARDLSYAGSSEAEIKRQLPVVIDAAYAQKLGFASPAAAVGQLLYGGAQNYTVIGVVESRPNSIKNVTDSGTFYALVPDLPGSMPLVRIDADDLDGGLTVLRRVWGDLSSEPLEVALTDDFFKGAFQTFELLGTAFIVLALLAFAIAAMGLFGMAVHTTQQRIHEIGVRKTLGSSISQVVVLLLTDFSKPVVIANLVAWPIAYVGVQAYLSGFTSRIDLSPWYFVLSLVITLSIAWLAVGGQTLKAASVRPAQVLRNA